jgi:hypothetical protein
MEPGHGVSRMSTPRMTPGKNEPARLSPFERQPTAHAAGCRSCQCWAHPSAATVIQSVSCRASAKINWPSSAASRRQRSLLSRMAACVWIEGENLLVRCAACRPTLGSTGRAGMRLQLGERRRDPLDKRFDHFKGRLLVSSFSFGGLGTSRTWASTYRSGEVPRFAGMTKPANPQRARPLLCLLR